MKKSSSPSVVSCRLCQKKIKYIRIINKPKIFFLPYNGLPHHDRQIFRSIFAASSDAHILFTNGSKQLVGCGFAFFFCFYEQFGLETVATIFTVKALATLEAITYANVKNIKKNVVVMMNLRNVLNSLVSQEHLRRKHPIVVLTKLRDKRRNIRFY